MKYRNSWQSLKDFIFFPIRAFLLFEEDKFSLSSLQTDRYYYVAREVKGRCLDVGCGRNNRFINEFLGGSGVGIDVYKYEGLTDQQIIADMTKLLFADGEFETITLIANINHIPRSIRIKELKELYRILKKGGRIVLTMGNPFVEIIVHKVVWFYDKFFKTKFDVDSQRGMKVDEEYFLTEKEIRDTLYKAGFKGKFYKKRFFTQWRLNSLYCFEK